MELAPAGSAGIGAGGLSMHVNKVDHVTTVERVAARLGESVDFIHDVAARGRRRRPLYVATLMKRMGIEALYRRPNTSKPAPGHKIYPYLLRGVTIDRPNHVWAMDISYIPMRRGFVYLAAVVDVASRRVLAHRVSITT